MNVLSLLAVGVLAGSWLAPFVVAAYTLVTFGAIAGMSRLPTEKQRRRAHYAFVAANVIAFFVLQHLGLVGVLSLENAADPKTLPFLLGFAFYVLQSLAVSRAVCFHAIAPLSLPRYALAISFCGSFVAGPLFNREQLAAFERLAVRWPTLKDLYETRHLFVGALIFKYVLSAWLARWVDVRDVSGPIAIVRSVLAFEFQVYFDFAGYSMLALAISRWFGMPSYHNFRHPFAARDIPEFWRRWHVGLGAWFKENLYSPLKGLLPGSLAAKIALPFAVFLASAMWHGPTLNFLAWGLFHAIGFVLAVQISARWGSTSFGALVTRLQVLAVVFYGRLLFMDVDFARTLEKLRILGNGPKLGRELLGLGTALGAVLVEWRQYADDLVIGSAVVAIVAYELFSRQARDGEPYRYLRGAALPAALVIAFLVAQPLQTTGFVYGR